MALLGVVSAGAQEIRSVPADCSPYGACVEDLGTLRARALGTLKARSGVSFRPEERVRMSPEFLRALSERVQTRLEELASEDNLKCHLDKAVEEARREWLQAFRRLEERLRVAGETAEGWRAYLDWPAVRLLAGKEPAEWPKELLERLYQRLAAGHPGLELRPFTDLRIATERLLLRETARRDSEVAQNVATVAGKLAELLAQLGEHPSSETLLEFYQLVNWLEVLGIREQLLPELREVFSGANVRTSISQKLVQAVIDRPVDDVSPVYEVILGTELSGTGHTRGELRATLLPDDTAGLVVLSLTGVVNTKAVGVNGPVQLLTRGRTQMEAEKLLAFRRTDLLTAPSYSRGVTESHIDSLWAMRGGAIVEQIAWRRSWSQKPLAEWIAARRAEARMNRRLDREIDRQLKDLLGEFERRVVDPLDGRGLFPHVVRWRTTSTHLEGSGWITGVRGITTLTTAPELPEEADLAVAIHDSSVNLAIADCLAGMILREMDLRRGAEDLIGTVPAWMEVEDPAEPWTIYLAKERPIEVAFYNGQMRFTLRGRSYEKGGRSYPGMNVTVVYRLEVLPDRLVAVREGDLQIYPPDFDLQQRRLSAREQVLRTLLERRFAKVFPPEWQAPALAWHPRQPGYRSQIELRPVAWQTANGWLILAWKLVD